MSIGEVFRLFWNDGKVEILVLLVVLDFFLGVIAALKTRTFRLSYIADFVRKDVIFKIGGYLFLYAGSLYAGQADFFVDGLDLGVAAGAAQRGVGASCDLEPGAHCQRSRCPRSTPPRSRTQKSRLTCRRGSGCAALGAQRRRGLRCQRGPDC